MTDDRFNVQVMMDKKLGIPRLETTDSVWEGFKMRAQAYGFQSRPLVSTDKTSGPGKAGRECPLFVTAFSRDSDLLNSFVPGGVSP